MIAKYEWHPFTISSAPEQEGKLEILCVLIDVIFYYYGYIYIRVYMYIFQN